MEKILIGSDHAGFSLKTFLKEVMEQDGLQVVDVGCAADISCDYPDYARLLCERIQSGEADRGVLICGTGLGMSMAANRFRGIRAALCTSEYQARMSRAHNDANVLIIGGRVTGVEVALSILRSWLETSFEGGRHQRRIDRIESP
jgi:ribose 5-phosphate isomerase B